MKLDIQKMKEEHQYGVRDSEDKFITSFTKGKCYRDEQLGYELFDRLLLTPLTYERVLEINTLEDDIKWGVKERRLKVSDMKDYIEGCDFYLQRHKLIEEFDIEQLQLKEVLKQLKKELKQSPEFNLRFDTTDLSAYKEVV
jgi:hypothetical protein